MPAPSKKKCRNAPARLRSPLSQAEHNTHPFAKKLAVDPYMRVVGAEDIIAIGDCAKMVGSPLPATAQVRPRTRGLFLPPVGLASRADCVL
jgi:hypothetical protein